MSPTRPVGTRVWSESIKEDGALPDFGHDNA